MLSYRHAFHAGNHADVLKHYVLSLVLDYFNQKDKPYWFIDTHAGAGVYSLADKFAQKNAEFEEGIARLLSAKNIPQSLENYIKVVKDINPHQELKFYPGSPKIAEAYLRTDDKLRLFELHPNDYKILSENFKSSQTKVELQNGFAGIKACLPPPTKRAVILIDPPYELKTDYDAVVDCLKDSLKRFATGTYLIWYPLLPRPEPHHMLNKLKALNVDFLRVEIMPRANTDETFGMYGSGMFVINPPWNLPALLKDTIPVLQDLLAADSTASFTLEHQIS